MIECRGSKCLSEPKSSQTRTILNEAKYLLKMYYFPMPFIKTITMHVHCKNTKKICLTSITKMLHVFPEVDSKHSESESEWNQDSGIHFL
jgi:hypothetical protein